MTPFALTSAAQFRPDHGPAVTVRKGKPSDAFRKEVDQQLMFSAGLTDIQKVIALCWEDPPGSEAPPGHWNLFAQWVSRRNHHSLDEDAKVFFALNNSGHSTFSAAAAALLKAATGSDTFGMSVTIPAGSSTVEPGAVPPAR